MGSFDLQRVKEKKVLLVSFYGRVCLSTKVLSGILKDAGHQTVLVYFKEDRSVPIEELQENSKSFQIIRADSGLGIYGTSADINPITEEDWHALEKIVTEVHPDVVGVSSRSPHLEITQELVRRLRLIAPSARFVAGGYGPSLEPEKFLEGGLDYVCIGKGDQAILDMVELSDPSECANVASLRQGALYLSSLDDLPDLDHRPFPDWDYQNKYLIEDGQCHDLRERYDTSNYGLIASEGCPSRCTYCQACQWPSIYRLYGYQCQKISMRSPERVIEELKYAKNVLGAKTITFMDSIFTWHKKWFYKFIDLYNKEINLPFIAFTDPRFTNREQIKLLKESLFISTTLGIQSVNEEIRKNVMGRHMTNKNIIDIAECLYEHEIQFTYDIILWNPFETEDTLRSGVDLLKFLPHSNRINIYELKLFPKSEISMMFDRLHPETMNRDSVMFWSIIFIMILRFKETKIFALDNYTNMYYKNDLEALKREFFNIVDSVKTRERLIALQDISKGTLLRTTMFAEKISDDEAAIQGEYRHAINGRVAISDIKAGDFLKEGDFYWSYHPL